MGVLEYSHQPDPIIIGQPFVITRRFRSLMDKPIMNLTEKFQSYTRTGSTWNQTFRNGPFSRCGSEQYQTACPLEAGTEFAFHEKHPSTHVALPGDPRAVEHYFADDVFAG